MNAASHKLRRLRRIERVRTVARHTATVRAAEAEGTLGQLMAIRSRTKEMAEGYDPQDGCLLGADLGQIYRFVDGLTELSASTERDVQVAQVTADEFQQELAKAERQRSFVSERVVKAEKAAQREDGETILPRRRNWHAS